MGARGSLRSSRGVGIVASWGGGRASVAKLGWALGLPLVGRARQVGGGAPGGMGAWADASQGAVSGPGLPAGWCGWEVRGAGLVASAREAGRTCAG